MDNEGIEKTIFLKSDEKKRNIKSMSKCRM